MSKKSPAVTSPTVGKPALVLGGALLAVLLAAWPALALQPVLPTTWLQSSTTHFRYYYRPGDETLLRQVAEAAERSHDWVTRELDWDPGIVDVTLLTYTDLVNGLTTPLPDTRIRLYLTPPDSTSSLIAYRDWIEMLFVHEYIHAVHLDMAHGPTLWLRYIMGRRALTTLDTMWGNRRGLGSGLQVPVVPFISTVPNALLMPWQTEGLATVYESWATGRGRLSGPYGRMVLRTAALGNRIPDWSDMASGDFLAWPYGSSWYLFGARYMAWLQAHKGRDTVVRWQHHNAWGFFPFFSWLSLATADGGSLPAGWEDMRNEEIRQAHLLEDEITEPAYTILDGASVTRQPVSDGKSLFWLKSDGSKPPVIRQWQPGWRYAHNVAEARTADQLTVNARWIVTNPLTFVDEYRLQRILKARRRRDGKIVYLKDSLRLTDPALDENDNIYAVRRTPEQSSIVRGHLDSDGEVFWSQKPLRSSRSALLTPVPSPGKKWLAYVIHTPGKDHDLRLLNLQNGVDRSLVLWSGEELFPAWEDENTLRFSSSRTGRFALYQIRTSGGDARLLLDTATGVFGSTRLGDHLYVARYDTEGFSIARYAANLAVQALPDPAIIPNGEMPPASDTPGTVPDITDEGVYQPWRSMLPRYWMPLLWIQAASDLNLSGVGASTGGEDILGQHHWGLTLFSATDTWQPSWQASYQYEGLVPHLSLSGGQDYSRYLSHDQTVSLYDRSSYMTMAATMVRPGIQVSHSSSLVFNYASWQPADGIRQRGSLAYGWQAGPGLRFALSSMTQTQLLDAGHDGIRLGLAADLLATGQPGSRKVDGSYVAIAKASLSAAKSLFWSNRISLSIEAGAAAGSALRSRAFTLSPVDGTGLIATSYETTRRGFNVAFSGSRLFYSGVQLSQPLWLAQQGWRWFPFLFRRLDLHLFAEAADIRNDWSQIRPEPVVGTELRASAVLAQIIPLDFVVGFASPLRHPKNWLIYFAPTSRF